MANVKSVVKDYRKSLSFAGYSVGVEEQRALGPSFNHLEGLQDVQLGGQTLSISKKYLLEAYEKTLEERLRQVKQALLGWDY